MLTDKLNNVYDQFLRLSVEYAPKLVLAILVLLIGWWLIKRIVSLSGKAMEKRSLDPSLNGFLRTSLSVALKVVLLITVAGMIGIQTTSFLTVLGAAGLAIGLALQGSLSNFAGGALILAFKPFKVGDSIETANYSGEVKEIQIFNTILLTPEHKTVIIPNGMLSNGIIVNNSTRGDVRAEIQLRVLSSHPVDEVRRIIMEIINSDERILKVPEPQVLVAGFGNDTLNIIVRFFTKTSEKSMIESECWEKIKKEFDKNGIQEARNYTILKNA